MDHFKGSNGEAKRRGNPTSHPGREWVERSKTVRALDLVFTLYSSELMPNWARGDKK